MQRSKTLFAAGLWLILCGLTWADIPKLINFQGILNDTGGNPLANDTVQVIFTIYDDPSAGNVKWTETDTVITDADGLLGILLGGITPIPDTAFTGTSRWLGIKVGTDAEMSPRQRLVSMPYSYEFDDSGPDSVVVSSGTAFLGKAVGSATEVVGISGYSDQTGLGFSTAGRFLTSTGGAGFNIGVETYGNATSAVSALGVFSSASNSGTGTAVGGQFGTSSLGSGVHYGIYAQANGGGASYGVWGDAKNTSSGYVYGARFKADTAGTGNHYGVRAEAFGNSSAPVYGINADADNLGSGGATGGLFSAGSNTSTGIHAGVNSQASGTGTTFGVVATGTGTGPESYGLSANASGAGGGEHYAVKGFATGGTILNYAIYGTANGISAYAGKFESAKVGIGDAGTQNIADGDGDLYVEDELEADGDVHLDDNTLRVYSASSLVTMGSDTINTQSSKLYINRTENTASPKTALYVQAKNSSSGGTTGIFSQATGTPAGTGLHVGVSGIANNTSGQSIGVDAEALGTGSNTGLYATASGGTTNYAVYGEALTGTSNYAGYFTGNKVRLATNATGSTSVSIGDRWRDNAIVAWGTVTSGAILSQEFGVSTFVNDSTGVYTITIDASAATGAELLPIAIAEIETPSSPRIININQSATNQFQVFIFSLAGTRVNNDFVFVVTAR